MPKHIVHRTLQIRVAESFDYNSIDMRNVAFDSMPTVDANDCADSNRTIERGPEMKLMRSVRLPLRRDYPSKRVRHYIALKNSSVSRIPYAILSQRPSGSASGAPSAIIHREISSARDEISSVIDAST